MAMDVALSPVMAASGFLPSGSLLQSLILLSNEVASEEKAPFVQARILSTMRRRIKLLAFLFEEVQESNCQLPPSSILCLTELFSVIRRVKILTQDCEEGSCLWSLLQTQFISNQFYLLVKEIGRVLDILPLSLLKLTDDTREQVELLHSQAKRLEFSADPRELRRREELLQLMNNKDRNYKNKGLAEVGKVKEIFNSVGLRSLVDCDEEISKLEAEALKQAGTGGLIVVSNINNIISLVMHAKSVIFSTKENENAGEKFNLQFQHSHKHLDQSSSSQSLVPIPDDFRCPISLDLMRDPFRGAGRSHFRVQSSFRRRQNDSRVSGGKTCNISSDIVEIRRSKDRRKCCDCIVQPRNLQQQQDPALVRLLKEGNSAGKRDAATALCNLGLYDANKASIVVAGAVPLLINLLTDDKAGITDDALQALSLVLGCSEGLQEIRKSRVLVPLLIDLLRFGSPKGKESSITLLLGLCKDGGEEVARRLLINPRSIPSLQSLAADGSLKARRKADALLRLLNRCCFQSQPC